MNKEMRTATRCPHFSLSKKSPKGGFFGKNREEVKEMYEREVDGRRKVAVTDIEALVPENHLIRKIEKVMDYEWIYERVAPYYSAAKK